MLVMTMMVRDEADLIAATIEHHLAQGVDRIIVTDNASIDGTREILDDYAAVAPVTVHHDGEHRKQQGAVVTRMAREAAAMGATWVVNGDADEFVRPRDPAATLADVMAAMPTRLGAFDVPVVNLVGPFAPRGAGLRRLTLRDERSDEQLQAAGIDAHPTPNAIHVGDPDVVVVQGNHATSIAQRGDVPAGLELEVLHLPWRSAAQVARKTENMGRGYDANPELQPSPNHHGMRDWRRMRADRLLPFLSLRMPTSSELAADGFVHDAWLADALDALEPLLPERLAASFDDAEPYADDEILALRARARELHTLDVVAHEDVARARMAADAARDEAVHAHELHVRSQIEIERLRAVDDALASTAAELELVRARLQWFELHPAVRAARAARRVVRGRRA